MITPFVSILIPIRNEAAYIDRCLQAVFSQNYPLDCLEVLISDGMSEDGTKAKLETIQSLQPSVKIFDNLGLIVPMGLNILIPNARGEILIRVDGHCIIAPDYVKNCVTHLQNCEANAVGGPMETIGETPLAQTIAIAMSSPFGVGNSAFRTTRGKSVIADTVPFPAYTRSMILKAGLYDEELVRNQDDEYNYRVRSIGGKLLLADDVRSQYYSRASINKLWKQYFQYGYYKVRVLQKHPGQMSARQFIPPIFVLSLFTSVMLSFISSFGRVLVLTILLLYLAANFTASLHAASKKGWRHLLLLPITYSVLHLSYGSGFLAGLVKFWNRWGDKKGLVPEWKVDNSIHG